MYKHSSPAMDTIDKEEVIQEFAEREVRTRNLIIIYKVKESQSQITADRIKNDITAVHKILKSITSKDLITLSVTKIGTRTLDRPRPIRVTLEDPEIVTQILRMKPIYKGVEFVASDRTKHQRQYLNKLKEKVDRENSIDGAVKTIRYVRGSPSIAKIQDSKMSKNLERNNKKK
jgi:hypothetical protein